MNDTYMNVSNAGFVGLFIGFLLGGAFVGFLMAAQTPLDYGRYCDEETEYAVILDLEPARRACVDQWRIERP